MNRPARLADDASPHEARFTIAQYRRIAESGALDRFGKTELHEGRIVVMNAQHVPHGRFKTELGFALRDALRLASLPFGVLIETDVDLSDDLVLQPDVTIWEEIEVEGGIPVERVRLIFEVADSTKSDDLGWKRARYAEAGVAEYWVAVLKKSRFERFAQPDGADYKRRDRIAFADGISALTLPISIPSGLLRS